MTREEYLKELNKAFGDFKFFEADHHYEYKGKRVGMSVTRLIEEYTQEFDSQAIAEKVATKNKKNYDYATIQLKYYNPLEIDYNGCEERYEELKEMLKQPITIQEVLDEWKQKNQYACDKGHLGHLYAQSLWNGENVLDEIEKFTNGLETLLDKILDQADNFYHDYQDRLEHLADEFVIGSEEYDIASAIDHLFINKLTGGLVLVDYKTNSDIHKNERYAKNMKVPLSHLKDFTLNHYYIQLSIYKYIVEKYTNLKFEEMFIVWFSENIDNYQIIEVPYLKNEVEEILENRRVKNMNGMGVLIMGASGSGKSTSLRNLPAKETAIINITNKPMPFRNKDGKTIVTLKDFAKEGEKDLTYEELYKRIIATIKGTKKKIIVIDDSSYMMAFENFEKATNKGYDKFTTMAKNYYDLIKSAISCGDEKIVYVITHEEIDDVNQLYRPKTIGKMLSNQLVIEGLFSIVLRSMYKNGEYIFQTQNDGTSVCKSPMDMFQEKEIPNDLFEVDKIVREYYGFKPLDKEESEDK